MLFVIHTFREGLLLKVRNLIEISPIVKLNVFIRKNDIALGSKILILNSGKVEAGGWGCRAGGRAVFGFKDTFDIFGSEAPFANQL